MKTTVELNAMQDFLIHSKFNVNAYSFNNVMEWDRLYNAIDRNRYTFKKLVLVYLNQYINDVQDSDMRIFVINQKTHEAVQAKRLIEVLCSHGLSLKELKIIFKTVEA